MRYPDDNLSGPFFATRYQYRQYRRAYARYYGPKHGCLLWISFILLCGWTVSIVLGTFHWSLANVLIVVLTFLALRWAARPRHRRGEPSPR
jgi:hypothetical protein